MPTKHYTAPAAAPVSGPQGWYLGVGLAAPDSLTAKDTYNDDYGDSYEVEQTNFPLGFNVFAGYRLTPNFGTEAGFSYLSKIKGDSTIANVKTTDALQITNNIRLYYDGLLYIPIACGFEAFGKAGIGYLYEKSTYKDALTTADDETHGALAINYGVGLGYNYQQFGMDVNYTRYQPSKSVEDDINDGGYLNDLISLNVKYYFG
jgi:hypothetical protein